MAARQAAVDSNLLNEQRLQRALKQVQQSMSLVESSAHSSRYLRLIYLCITRPARAQAGLLLFLTLVTGARRSLSLKLSDTRVCEPQLRARLGTTAHFCELKQVHLRELERRRAPLSLCVWVVFHDVMLLLARAHARSSFVRDMMSSCSRSNSLCALCRTRRGQFPVWKQRQRRSASATQPQLDQADHAVLVAQPSMSLMPDPPQHPQRRECGDSHTLNRLVGVERSSGIPAST